MICKLSKLNVSLLFLSITFLVVSYLSVGGVRLIIFPIIFIVIFLFINEMRLSFDLNMFLFLIYVFYAFLCSVYVGDYSVFSAMVVFFLFAFWPFFIKKETCKDIDLNKLIRAYVYSSLLCSVGVVLQFLIYRYLNIEFGKIDFYYQRTGFGFLWLDYSFLSLFLVSAVPFVISMVGWSKLIKTAFTLVLLIGALSTSARTGIFSLFFIVSILISYNVFLSLYSGKIKVVFLLFIVITVLFVFLLPVIWSSVSDRELTISGSGRLEGYTEALSIYYQNPFFGFLFDTNTYSMKYGAIPHNLIIYILTFSGMIGAVFLFSWLVMLLTKALRVRLDLKISFFIVLLGTQFIPSIFSAYFIAFLISFIYLYNFQEY